MSDRIRVRVQYDGSGPAHNAKVTDANTGAVIEGIARVVLDANKGVPTAVLYAYEPIVDVTADARVLTICPACKGLTRQQKRQRRRHRAIFRRNKRGLA